MKIRDSGMPDEAVWESFFDPDEALAKLGLADAHADVVDFGCGYGTFTLAAARRTTGTVHAIDMDAAMIEATAGRAVRAGLANVRAIARDFVALGTGLADASVDYALLFNILHAEDPMTLLREAGRVLRPTGKLAVIHWKHDASTPRGPPLDIRPTPDQCKEWIRAAGFDPAIRSVDLPPFHYGLVACREDAGPSGR